MGTPTIARLLDSNDRRAVAGLRHVERWKGPDRATAASRRDARHGSRPPTGVGAVVREGVTKWHPGARCTRPGRSPRYPRRGPVTPAGVGSLGSPARLHPVADLPPAEARVLSAVDEAWALSRLRDLVAVPSVGGTAAECDVQHLVGDGLEEVGCAVHRWSIDRAAAATAPDAPGQEVERTEAWGVGGTAPTAEEGLPALVLSGHTDVVPPGDRALWPGDPFDPRIADGAVHGRGSCDMK